MPLCEYGCGRVAKYQFKNGKWCCRERHNSCPMVRKKVSIKIKEIWEDPKSKLNSDLYKKKQSNIMKMNRKDPNSIFNSKLYKENHSNGMEKVWADPDSIFNSEIYKENQRKATIKINKLTIEQINERYPFFSKIEEMRYTSNKLKKIQVRCKNHECKNSKEKDGWFTPTYWQLNGRIGALENPKGFGESNFYCSQHCKDSCSLFNVKSDPYKDTTPLPYTAAEKEVWRQVVLKRENGLCEYCGEPAEHVHHIFPVKIEPFFALDPDYGVACCAKHHYKYGHRDECSTGNLAKIVCSVELQKFLNQKI